MIGGEYQVPEFRSVEPGTQTMAGPYEDERRARNEWIRLTYCPHTSSATTRYSIAAEAVH